MTEKELGKIDLVYRLGTIEVNLENLAFQKDDPYYAKHKFVVEGVEPGQATLYVVESDNHDGVRGYFRIQYPIGGGSIWTKDEDLYIGDYSGNFGEIPGRHLLKFGELLRLHLREAHALNLRSVKHGRGISYGDMDSFWEKY